MIDFARLRTDLLAIACLAGVVFYALALTSYDPADAGVRLVYPAAQGVQNLAGSYGARVANASLTAVGVGAYVLLGLLVAWNLSLFSARDESIGLTPLVGVVFVVVGFSVGMGWAFPAFGPPAEFGSGGYAAVTLLDRLTGHLSPTGVQVMIVTLLCAGLLLLSDLPLLRHLLRLPVLPFAAVTTAAGWLHSGQESETDRVFRKAVGVEHEPRSEPADGAMHDDAIDEPLSAPTAPAVDDDMEEEVVVRAAISSRPVEEPRVSREPSSPTTLASLLKRGASLLRVAAPVVASSKPKPQRVTRTPLPKTSLLEPAEEFPAALLAKKARIAAETLERTFQEFNLNVRVVDAETGPVITQFELDLEKGLRVSKVAALADDLAIALRVPSVRVVSPIPGKNTVGVEVPNEKQVMVRMRELMDESSEEADRMRIPLFVGKDVSGGSVTVDMAKMPHLLIAGRTGTGKSVCLNTLILSVLMSRTPDEVRMLMIDPKMVELSPYRRVPHLMHPVITDMKQAEAALAWAVEKMDERYELLAQMGVRHLDGYNALDRSTQLDRMGLSEGDAAADHVPERMPYMMIIADEMADMMMTSGKEVESHIIRLAQKSRAVGIHLVLATQKPTVDVITGLIKSNLPARISFQVASKSDSRVVLDEQGADKLLGNGDLLYLAPGTSNLTRAQGTYVSDEEINAVIDFYSDQPPQYDPELENLGKSDESSGSGPSSDRLQDDLYLDAIDVVVREGRGSVSLLQRCLGIGYGRAARLIDYMAEDGIVGDYNGSQAREVVYTAEEWEATRAQFAR